MGSKYTKFVAFSDTHCPFHDEKAVSHVLDVIREQQPDVVVHVGDLLEADAASRFDNEQDITIMDEFLAGESILARVMDAAPKAKFVLCEGNHDNNILRPGRLSKKVREALDYRKNLPSLKHWEVVPYINCPDRGVYRIGQVTFCHGFSTGRRSDLEEAVLLGVPHGLCIRGHSHAPLPVTQALLGAGIPLPYHYANTGTLGPLKPQFMIRDRTHLWGRAVAVGEAKIGRLVLPRPHWKVDVEIFGMGPGMTKWSHDNVESE